MLSFQGLSSLITIILVIRVETAPTVSHGLRNDVEIPEVLLEVSKRAAGANDGHDHYQGKRVKRVPAIAAEKALEIGGEMAAKVADKLIDKIGEAGDRAAGYLENGASVDIQPQNGFVSEDMFAAPAWHIETGINSEDKGAESNGIAYTYPMGIGPMMMNGCWGTGYQPGDACYQSRVPSKSTCVNKIDGAAIIGVGFDGRGEYSPNSRKMSIIQIKCESLSTYDGYDVPDTMNVHGIYETKTEMMTYKDRDEYTSHLQEEAGVSGSYSFLSAGVSAAYGTATTSNQQQYLSIMDMDIIRYEIFKDVVTPNDLTPAFLQEFMDLPTSYMVSGAPYKFQDFILRWGTHYIKSGEFGGRLEIRKVASASHYSSQEEFATESKVDFDNFFSSFHAKSSTKSGSTSTKQSSYSSTSILAIGGSQEIAALVTDEGSPTIKTDIVNWLNSIPDYPKAFKFGMGPITDLLYFNPSDIFPTTDYGQCGARDDLKTDSSTGKKYYEVEKLVANVTVTSKVYCYYRTKDHFLTEITQKRKALQTAISIYMSEGLVSKEDMTISAGSSYCDIDYTGNDGDSSTPDWTYMSSGSSFTVVFDMKEDLKDSARIMKIKKDEVIGLHYYGEMWFVEGSDGIARLADGYGNGGSRDLNNKKISVDGLVLTFIPGTKMLMLMDDDYEASLIEWPQLKIGLKGHYLARVEWPMSLRSANAEEKNFMNAAVTSLPCNVHWSNIQTFDIMKDGVCTFFSAVSEGTIFVVFASVPRDRSTWYYVEISPSAASIHKNNRVLTQTSNWNARGLGDATLHQNYFVCVEFLKYERATLIEYGKYMGDENERIIYLSYKDKHSPIKPVFYAFGSGSKDVTVFQVNLPRRQPPTSRAQCGPGTQYQADSKLCVLNCHPSCHPDYGCVISQSGQPSPTLCNECRNIRKTMGTKFECTDFCPIATIVQNGKSVCPCKWFNGECLTRCPLDTELDSDTSQCGITG
ncbi:uncharacterized protein LOC144439764 [Glandiceps talaboti]